MPCHHSSTWQVKTCLRALECNDKLLHMADIHTKDRPEVTAVDSDAERTVSFSKRESHLLWCRGSVHQINGSSILRAQLAKLNKQPRNVTAPQYLSPFLLSSYHPQTVLTISGYLHTRFFNSPQIMFNVLSTCDHISYVNRNVLTSQPKN